MSLGLILNVIVGFSVVDGRWRGREAILDLDFTISHRCKCQFCQKRFSLRVLALRRVCKQMTIVAMRPCCKTGAKVVLRRSTTLKHSASRPKISDSRRKAMYRFVSVKYFMDTRKGRQRSQPGSHVQINSIATYKHRINFTRPPTNNQSTCSFPVI